VVFYSFTVTLPVGREIKGERVQAHVYRRGNKEREATLAVAAAAAAAAAAERALAISQPPPT
jgi:hypothetical protein